MNTLRMKPLLGIAALILANQLVFAQGQAPQLSKATIDSAIANVCEALKNNYVYPDKAKQIVDHLFKQQQQGVYKELTKPSTLADQIEKDIRSVANDKHLRVVFDPELEKDIIRFNQSQKTAQLPAKANAKDKSINFYFKKVELLPSNIGYIEFNGFSELSEEAEKTMAAVMQFVAHADALIIDLRNNRGGNAALSNALLSYFFDKKTKTGKSYNRLSNSWTDNYVGERQINSPQLFFSKPIYILTSRNTYSAAEGFAYILQTLKNAKVVGNITSGGAHLTRSFSLGKGFVGFIPYLRSENIKTNTDWEGTGIIPDLKSTDESPLGMAQRDILENQLLKAGNQAEKNKINWLLNYYKSKSAKIVLDPAEIKNFVGRFAEFEVSLTDGQLMFRDVNQPNYIPQKLVAISKSFFQVGEDYQVAFISNESNQVDAIKMTWSDGWTEEIKRSQH